MEHASFRYKNLDELKQDIKDRGLNIPISYDLDLLRKSLPIGEKIAPNRLAIHPMEGCDGTADGKPSELTLRRYDRFARGGAGLLWVEASAVQFDGRANPRQLYISRENKADFEKLVDTINRGAKEEFGSDFKPYTVLQMTHSGRYSRPYDKPAPIIATKNPYLDKFLSPNYRIITDGELEKLEDKFVEGAILAKEIGFDGVDIKSCHRYLSSELLSSHTREGKYGGSFENRTRFLLNIVDKIKDRLGDGIDITVRLNAYDAIPYPYGWGVDKEDFHKPDLTEPIRLIGMLKDRGVRLINITIGNPYYNPHVGRPYDMGPYVPPEHPLDGIDRFLNIIKDVQTAVPDMPIISTGYSWLRDLAPYVAAGGIEDGWFKMAGFGRQAFAYPNFARDIIEKGEMDRKKCCISCSKCTEIMRYDGTTGCVIKDAKVYAPIYKKVSEGKKSLQGNEVKEHI